MPVLFAPRTVSSVRFRVDQAQDSAVGLAEIQVLGALASSTENVPPHFVEGPWPVSRTIPASQSTEISVVASDVDGDALAYQWSAEAGSVTGSGATVLYTPPPVSETTWLTVSVTVSDGRGGSATNSTYVQVTQVATSSVAVSPTLVFAGDPATGSIALAAPAPAGGTVVPLSSSSPSVVTVPASVTVPAGQSGATFPVATAPVTVATSATITASFGEGPRSATLSLVPVSVASLSVAPANVLGGTASQGTVTLPGPAGAAGVSVQLTSSNPASATVPATVTVPAGASTATFPVSTSPVTTATAVILSATWGTTATAVLTVSPLAVCAPGTTSACPGESTGACSPGTQTCNADGTLGTCTGVIGPVPEVCSDGIDNDCDGFTDCDDPDCAAACGPGPEPTRDAGVDVVPDSLVLNDVAADGVAESPVLLADGPKGDASSDGTVNTGSDVLVVPDVPVADTVPGLLDTVRVYPPEGPDAIPGATDAVPSGPDASYATGDTGISVDGGAGTTDVRLLSGDAVTAGGLDVSVRDARGSSVDGAGLDGGSTHPTGSSGCGCSIGGTPQLPRWGAWLVIFGLLLWRRARYRDKLPPK
jgi:MYXO-CTERM domain-containing protein